MMMDVYDSRSFPPPPAVHCFVSRKVNAVQWLTSASGPARIEDDIDPSCGCFVAGSWDEQAGQNRVSVWDFVPPSPSQGSTATYDVRDPVLLCDTPVDGSVSDLKILRHGAQGNASLLEDFSVVVGTSAGSVSLMRVEGLMKEGSDSRIYVAGQMKKAHTAPVTSIASCNTRNEFVSAGEDGKVVRYSLSAERGLIKERTLLTDHSSVTGVSYCSPHTVATTSSSGQLKIWDVDRDSSSSTPALTMHLSDTTDTNGHMPSFTCIGTHPSMPDKVSVGCSDGTVCVWDTRNTSYPELEAKQHDGPVWKVAFHPTSPDHLLSCAEDGKVYQWYLPTLEVHLVAECDLGVNSFDVQPNLNMLLCAADNEMLHFQSNLLQSDF
eukprot:TRINITY_DN9012_c0_g1_i1.p1 TRINITY_DN9012_c0_g1~~TRINITY_DN9012_c0_g1_i1.p1  ORF type:complete len:379 (-),score=71.08 TRINITY_DN9012_c0_g1_i1:190-1326(-)